MTTHTLAPSLLTALGLVASLAAGCDDADVNGQELVCPDDPGPFTLADSRVSGTAELAQALTEPLGEGDSVIIRGTATHEDGLAIREILVAGVSAEATTFNFGQWSAQLSYDSLALAAPADAAGDVVVEAVAIDACGNRYPFLEVALAIDPTPSVDVDSLTIEVTYPGGRAYVPSDESAAATLKLNATGRASGAEVTVAAATGTFQGLSAANTVRLFADGQDSASGTVLFYATEPGVTVITAVVDDTLAAALVVAAEAPSLAPRVATLVPGAVIEVQVLTEGALERCQATPSEVFEVRHSGVAIGAAAAAMSRDEDGAYLLEVEAAAEAAAAGSLTLTCVDEYGQAGSGHYELVVSDPPPEVEVEALRIDVEIPQGRDHLPASGATAAALTITGTGKPAGARVALSASSGAFQGASGDAVTLVGAGETASATALFYPDAPGVVVLTAAADGAVATATVPVVGAPIVAPAAATLLPGQSLDVVILTAGEVVGCRATPSTNLVVETEGGVLIGGAPIAVGDGSGAQRVRVRVPEDADDDATVELSCQDVWGQYGTAVLSAAVL